MLFMSWEFAASLWDWKAPHPVFDHPPGVSLRSLASPGEGICNTLLLGEKVPEGADEGEEYAGTVGSAPPRAAGTNEGKNMFARPAVQGKIRRSG